MDIKTDLRGWKVENKTKTIINPQKYRLIRKKEIRIPSSQSFKSSENLSEYENVNEMFSGRFFTWHGKRRDRRKMFKTATNDYGTNEKS